MSAARTNEPAVLPAVIIVARPIGAGRYQALVGGRVLVAAPPRAPIPLRATGGARHKRNVTSKPHPHENHQPTRNDPRRHAFTQRPSTGRPNTSLECHPSPAQDLATGRGCKLLTKGCRRLKFHGERLA
jgi:hypothetical protein